MTIAARLQHVAVAAPGQDGFRQGGDRRLGHREVEETALAGFALAPDCRQDQEQLEDRGEWVGPDARRRLWRLARVRRERSPARKTLDQRAVRDQVALRSGTPERG